VPFCLLNKKLTSINFRVPATCAWPAHFMLQISHAMATADGFSLFLKMSMCISRVSMAQNRLIIRLPLAPSTVPPLLPSRFTPPRPALPCMPLHRPGHAPSHVAATATAIPVTAIAAATTTSKAPCTNTFSPWDGDNVPLEVPEVQKWLAGPCRRVRAVSAIATRGGRGKLTVLGSKGL